MLNLNFYAWYLELLQNQVLPELCNRRDFRRINFMQDGATVHCTDMVLQWLDHQFPGRVISRRSAIWWPPQSPDLNPVDFWLWGHLSDIVWQSQPSDITTLMGVVETAAVQIPGETFENALLNFRKRIISCYEQNGGHFEQGMKKH